MRWHRRFVASAGHRLQQPGVRACPVCGRADSLPVGPFPVPLTGDASVPGAAGRDRAQHFDGITAAVKAEWTVCGHLLFDSLKFRTVPYRAGQDHAFRGGEEGQRHPDD